MFIPFFSTKGEYAVDPGQSRVKGTGLGLSICHTIVTNHGGEIDVESREGKGTSFTVSLPLSQEQVVKVTEWARGRA